MSVATVNGLVTLELVGLRGILIYTIRLYPGLLVYMPTRIR